LYQSPCGTADQRCAANRITPQKVLEAKGLITRGTVYQLGHVYESTMPLFGTRHFSLKIPQTFGPQGSNNLWFHDELVSGEIGQVDTQFDGLGHIGIGDLFYNGNNRADFSRPDGLEKLGIENVGPIVTRGVLVDVAAFKGVARLEGGYEITLADLRGALERQRIEVRSGDVIIVHTLSREELTLDVGGAAEFVDLESGRKLTVQPSAARESYVAAFRAWLSTVERRLQREGIAYLRLIADEPLEPALRRFLVARRGGS
jgi:hypothetical protein